MTGPVRVEKAFEHLASVQSELELANAAASLLEHWAQDMEDNDGGEPLAIGEVSRLLDVSLDVIRNWERDGLIAVPRNPDNGYRRFGKMEIERLRIIRMLSQRGLQPHGDAAHVHRIGWGNRERLEELLDAPRPDEDVFTAADHWLTTLGGQERIAHQVVQLIEELIARRVASP